MTGFLIALIAVLVDALCGEPRRWHPLVGFGRLANFIEAQFYGDVEISRTQRRWRGVVAVLVLLLPLTWLAWWFATLPHIGHFFSALFLYLAIGHRSLHQHAQQVIDALGANDLPLARQFTAYMVSRDTDNLDETGISKAVVESVLENGNDAVFATLFWFAVLGAPGAIFLRLSNTLDAMWGYKNQRYEWFGWAAARLDDVLNYIPARLTALTYALLGNTAQAINCWRKQAPVWKSPNAGPVMSSGAGALDVQLGGIAIYAQQKIQRPDLGCGRTPQCSDITAAQQLVFRGVVLWLICAAGFLLLQYFSTICCEIN
jgi:adenosylcobinamide-phosphate synthase